VETGTALILIAGMAVVTSLTRLPLVPLARRRPRMPAAVDRLLEQIPLAAFAAIIFPAVLRPHGDVDLSASNLYLYAATATVVAARLTGSALLSSALTGIVAAGLLHLAFS
jgi:branched-subunit amino acid transport protein